MQQNVVIWKAGRNFDRFYESFANYCKSLDYVRKQKANGFARRFFQNYIKTVFVI